MTSAFVSNPQRDAWKAIKGFCYQIELTVLRWLDLKADTILYCECGEDIDHVKEIINADDKEQTRLLEQVKTRNRISLGSVEALTALARFREAVDKNRSVCLLYRFSTTATASKEQVIHFPRNLAGIEAWNATREGAFTLHEAQDFIAALKNLLSQASCPPDLKEPVFVQLQEYIASTDAQALLDEFIGRFEWVTGLPDPPQLRIQIETTLLEQTRAHFKEEANLLADVLTVYVLHLLTQKGEKRLTTEDLEQVLRERSLTSFDRRLLSQLASFVDRAEAYFSHSTAQMEGISREITALQGLPGQLDQISQRLSGDGVQFLPVSLPPPDEPPFLPLCCSKRAELVQALVTDLSEVSWLALNGPIGIGKTSVARLVAEQYGLTRTSWIALRGEQAQEDPSSLIDLHLLRIASIPDRSDFVSAYHRGMLLFSQLADQAAVRLGTGTLLVIDELPDFLRFPKLGERLVQLVRALHESGAKLLTTAQRNLPSSVRGYLETVIAEREVPPLSQQETGEMFASVEAPSIFLESNYLSLIHAVTRGHPHLALATIVFLQRSKWAVDQNHLFSLLAGDPTKEARAETQRKVLRLLPDGNVREFLYRLSLIGSSFDSALADAVAGAVPVINRPGEYLPELIGPWVQQVEQNQFVVSPLLNNAGQATLAPEMQQRVHLAVGLYHMKHRSLNQEQAFQLIVHLSAAQAWLLLFPVLLQLTPQLTEKSHAEAFDFLTFLFPPSWSSTVPLLLRITLRTAQIRVLTLLGKDVTEFSADLDSLIQKADGDILPAALTALLFTGPLNPAVDPSTAARKALQAARIFPRLPVEFRQIPIEPSLESLIWAGVTHIKNRDDVRGIFAVLAEMTEEEKRAAFSNDALSAAPRMLMDRYLTIELTKTEGGQDWRKVLSFLNELSRVAALPGGEPLQPVFARTRAMILADYCEQPQDALAVIEQTLAGTAREARFLLYYTAGCILLDHSTPEAALAHYQSALAGSVMDDDVHLDTLRRAAEAAGRSGQWQLVQAFAVKSLKFVREELFVYERLEMLGELAWAHWSLGNRKKAWGAMAGLIRKLERQHAAGDRRFHEIFRKTQHALGWMEAVAKTGKPPAHAIDGRPYVEPFPGLFSRPRPHLADISAPMLLHVLVSQLGTFANGCGLHELAWRSIHDAKRLAKSQGFAFFQHFVDHELAQLAVRQKRYREACLYALSFLHSVPTAQSLREQGVNLLSLRESPKDVWNSLSGERRQEVERELFWAMVGPCITGLVADGVSAEAYATALSELEHVFAEFTNELVDLPFWQRLFHELRLAFSPTATQHSILEQIRRLPETESYCRVLLHLALSRVSDATLSEICAAQITVFDFFSRVLPVGNIIMANIALYLIRYWREVVDSQAFALRSPQVFRREIQSLQLPTPRNAATLLLLAADATGVHLNGGFRQSLTTTAHDT